MPFNGERFENVERVECESDDYGAQVCEIETDQWSKEVRVAGVAADWDIAETDGDSLVIDDADHCDIYMSHRSGSDAENVKVLQCWE